MDLKTLTEEQLQIVKNVIKTLKEDNAVNANGKKARKIKITKKDLQIALFMKNENDLGRAIGVAADEDIKALLDSVSGINNAEEIEKLKAEREALQAKAAEISKKIIALKAQKGPKIELI